MPADLDMFERLERRYMRDIEPEHEDRWAAALERNRELWRANLASAVVLESEGHPVGYALWIWDEGAAVLATVNVEPDARRHGFGRQLLAAYVERARSEGATALRLGVHRRNPARRLYESAGWQYAGTDGDYLLAINGVDLKPDGDYLLYALPASSESTASS